MTLRVISRSLRNIVFAFAIAVLLIPNWPCRSFADEHASHHGGASGAGMEGEMGGGGEMEGEPRRSNAPFYPSLMNLPSLTPEQRAQIDQRAQSRMDDGAALMSKGVDLLSNPNDYAAMGDGTRLIREGLDEFQSGLAAREALQGGTPPQTVAFNWFRQQLNLSVPGEGGESYTLLGLSPFHLFSMLLLLVVATAAIWVYFLRMRRARALMLNLAPAGAAPMSSLPGPAVQETPTTPSTPSPPAQAQPSASTPISVDKTTINGGGAVLPAVVSVAPARGAAKVSRWSGKLKVLRVFDENPDVRTFRLGDPDGGTLPFDYLPGQFLDLTVAVDGKQAKRSYSIASSPTERDYVEITVKREPVGLVSGYLHERVKEGERLQIAAPSGRFTFTGTEANSIVMIGGGVGITPLMSVIRYLTARGWPNEIVLLYCFREPRDFIFHEELEYLQRRNPNLRVIAAATRRGKEPWIGLEGRFTKEIIAYSLPKIASHRIHLCGPPPMMEAIRGMLLDLGVAKDQIKTEAFGTDQRRPVTTTQPATGIAAIDAPSTAPHRANGALATPLTAAAHVPTVKFTLSSKSAPLPQRKTILEAAEDVGVNIDYSCRSGTCGTCKVKLVSGSVTMEVDEGLDPDDKELGFILACQARATADVTVEA